MSDYLNDVKSPFQVPSLGLMLKKQNIVAKTRKIHCNTRLMTQWESEILEIMEDNNVPPENIQKVLELIEPKEDPPEMTPDEAEEAIQNFAKGSRYQ
jgi:hypothetical protein